MRAKKNKWVKKDENKMGIEGITSREALLFLFYHQIIQDRMSQECKTHHKDERF